MRDKTTAKIGKRERRRGRGGRAAAALYIWYFSLLPSYENEEYATSLAWPRHADRVNQTGIEAQAAWAVTPFQFG